MTTRTCFVLERFVFGFAAGPALCPVELQAHEVRPPGFEPRICCLARWLGFGLRLAL
jgi:hypothetical protein